MLTARARTRVLCRTVLYVVYSRFMSDKPMNTLQNYLLMYDECATSILIFSDYS